jgi:hypothetical protein
VRHDWVARTANSLALWTRGTMRHERGTSGAVSPERASLTWNGRRDSNALTPTLARCASGAGQRLGMPLTSENAPQSNRLVPVILNLSPTIGGP